MPFLTIGSDESKEDHFSNTLFFLKILYKPTNMCPVVKQRKLKNYQDWLCKYFRPKKYLQTNNRNKENKSKEKYTQNTKNYKVQQ